jgi:hypothetical protein
LAAAIAQRVGRLYSSEEESACPGENECPIWLSSAEDDRICPSCPKRNMAGGGSTPGESAVEPAHSKEMIDQIEALVNERNSGFGFPEDLTELEKELIILWDRNVGANERALQGRTVTLMEMLIGSLRQ